MTTQICYRKLPSLGITIEIEYDYEPPERQTFHSPGWPASVELTSSHLLTKSGERIDLFTLSDELGADEAVIAFLQKTAETHSEELNSEQEQDYDYRDPWESPCD